VTNTERCSKVDYLLLPEVGTPLKRVHKEDYTSGVWLTMILCGSEAGNIKSYDGCLVEKRYQLGNGMSSLYYILVNAVYENSKTSQF
jgi:hypothetical protein